MLSTFDKVANMKQHTLLDSRARLQAAAFEFIDDYKDRAFNTVFVTPTIHYFELVGDYTMAGDADVHGGNVYLALLMATLGVRLNRTPYLRDEMKGCVDFLSSTGSFTER